MQRVVPAAPSGRGIDNEARIRGSQVESMRTMRSPLSRPMQFWLPWRRAGRESYRAQRSSRRCSSSTARGAVSISRRRTILRNPPQLRRRRRTRDQESEGERNDEHPLLPLRRRREALRARGGGGGGARRGDRPGGVGGAAGLEAALGALRGDVGKIDLDFLLREWSFFNALLERMRTELASSPFRAPARACCARRGRAPSCCSRSSRR